MSAAGKEKVLLKPSDFLQPSLLLPGNISTDSPGKLTEAYHDSSQSRPNTKFTYHATGGKPSVTVLNSSFNSSATCGTNHNRSCNDVTMQAELTCHILLNDTKLRENSKILKAYDDGEFPIQRSYRKFPQRVSTTETTIPCTTYTTCDETCQTEQTLSLKEKWTKLEKEAEISKDTSNDAAIAALLQEEMNHQGSELTNSVTQDFHLACTLQEEYDKEMVFSHTHYDEPSNKGFSLITKGPSRRRHFHDAEYEISSGYESAGISYDDDMSYEVLSQLQDVSKGFTSSEISRYTTLYKYSKAESKHTESCSICIDEFFTGQQLRCLPCLHSFHRYCVDKWLFENQTCPICMKNIH